MHPLTPERKIKTKVQKKNEDAKTEKKQRRIFSRIKHISKNEDAKKKRRRKFLKNDVNLAAASTVYLLL